MLRPKPRPWQLVTSVAYSADIFVYEGLNLKQKVVFHNPCFLSMFLSYHYKIYPHQKKLTNFVWICVEAALLVSLDVGVNLESVVEYFLLVWRMEAEQLRSS